MNSAVCSQLAVLDNDIRDSWHCVGSSEGLATDVDIAKFLIAVWQKSREQPKLLCVRCQAPLTLYCTSCQLPSQPAPSSGHTYLPTFQTRPSGVCFQALSSLSASVDAGENDAESKASLVALIREQEASGLVTCENNNKPPHRETGGDRVCLENGCSVVFEPGVEKVESEIDPLALDDPDAADSFVWDSCVEHDVNTVYRGLAQSDRRTRTRTGSQRKKYPQRLSVQSTDTNSAAEQRKRATAKMHKTKKQKSKKSNCKTKKVTFDRPAVNKVSTNTNRTAHLGEPTCIEEVVTDGEEGVMISNEQRQLAEIYVYDDDFISQVLGQEPRSRKSKLHDQLTSKTLGSEPEEQEISDTGFGGGYRLPVESKPADVPNNRRRNDQESVIESDAETVTPTNVFDAESHAHLFESLFRSPLQQTVEHQVSRELPNEQSTVDSHGIPSLSKGSPKQILVSDRQIRSLASPNGKLNSCFWLECAHCKLAFKQKASFNRHISTHFGRKGYVSPCTKCNETNGNHDGPHDCAECGKTYSLLNTLTGHARTHHRRPEQSFECDLCGAIYSMLSNLTNHKRKAHPQGSLLQCQKCDFQCRYFKTMKCHKKKHENQRTIQCEICGSHVRNRANLLRHILLHKGEKPHKCSQCDRTFRCSKQLKMHTRSYHSEIEKPYRCDQCGRGFLKADSLKVHMYSHTGEKPHKCSICSSAFVRKDYLNKHMRTHTGEKPYRCSECGSKFAYVGSLKTHRLRHHNNDVNSSVEGKQGNGP